MNALLGSLSRLWDWTRSARRGINRRNAVRHPAVPNQARLSWWISNECFEVPVRFKDIGLMGASLVAKSRPPAGQSLWIRLEEPSQTEWFEVALAWVTKSGEIGLMFPDACPYDLFQAVVPGYKLQCGPIHVSHEFEDRYWR
jgi:hypothetical protein